MCPPGRCLLLLTLLFASASASAQTAVPPGVLVGSPTWTAAGSPYTLSGDVTIGAGTTLTVEAGVTVEAAASDVSATGLDATRIELVVQGTLDVNGTIGSPATFEGASPGAATWYGIVVESGATSASIEGAVLRDTHTAIQSAAAGTILDVADTTIENGSVHGIYLTNGSPLLDSLTISNPGAYGLRTVGGATSPTLQDSVVQGATTAGVYIQSTVGVTTMINGCTLDGNASGIYKTSSSPLVQVRNSIVTGGTYGIRRISGSFISVFYSDVWGNSINFQGVSPGTGTISANPLYVSATNLRLTENSPARFGGDVSQDMGALPYTSDPTPGLYGTLWSDTTLDAAGSPYSVLGDLTVASGVTLTLDPGAVVEAALSDLMAGGANATKVELVVNGSLVSVANAGSPATLTSAGGVPGEWYGVVVDAAATATLPHTIVEHAETGLRSSTSALTFGDGLVVRDSELEGMRISGGSPALAGFRVVGTTVGAGVSVSGSGAPTLSSCLLEGNATHGVQVASSGSSQIAGCTIVGNGQSGVLVSTSGSTLDVSDSIVTGNGTFGLQNSSGTVTATYNDVWGNGSSGYAGVTPGVGSIVANPIYVGGGSYALTENSPARFAGSLGQDLGAFPYVGDPTPGLYGTLWSNTTLDAAGSPYSVLGDLTVAPSVTLTLESGAVVEAALSDVMLSGANVAEVELFVNGSLVSTASAGSPATLTSPGGVPGEWVGVVVDAAATATLPHTIVEHAEVGLRSSTSALTFGAGFVVRDSELEGIRISGGSPVLTGFHVEGTTVGTGVSVAGSGAPTLSSCLLEGNATHGAQIASSGSSQIAGCTIVGNGQAGILVSASGSTLDVFDSIITANGTFGLQSTTGGTVTATYNDVWGNGSSGYSGVSPGVGSLVANPIYVGGGSYALTENSPARFAGSLGQDLGAFPFVGDPTPGLYGTLWSNTTLDAAGSPYSVLGDLTVAPGVTLTIGSSAVVEVALSDVMLSGANVTEVELVVNGTLLSTASAGLPATLTSAGGVPGEWYGVVVGAAATATLPHTVVEHAEVGLRSSTSALTAGAGLVVRESELEGIRISGGSPALAGFHVEGTTVGTGVSVSGSGAPTLSSCLLEGNATHGVQVASSGSSQIEGCTIVGNGQAGVRVSASGSTLDVIDSIVTSNGTFGLQSTTGATVTATYNDVWGNGSSNYSGLSQGAGSLVVNPLFLGGGSYALTENSPARFAGSVGQDIGAFPYVGDATPGVYGTLWSDTTLDAAGSPYSVLGDLTVAPGTTLTVEPGAVLEFADSDLLVAGGDTTATEFVVTGSLQILGETSNKVVLRGAPGVMSWPGVRLDDGSGGSLVRHAVVEDAATGFQLVANESVTIEFTRVAAPGLAGVWATDGTITLRGVRVHDSGARGVSLTGLSSAVITSSIFDHNGTDGIYLSHTLAPRVATIDSVTFDANTRGVFVAGSFSTANVRNAIFTDHTSTAALRTTGTFFLFDSLFWSNGSSLSGVSGTGWQFVDPEYVIPGSDYHLQTTSPCIDAGASTIASLDFDELPRPSGADPDCGAYELQVQSVPALGPLAHGALALALLAVGAAFRRRDLLAS